MRAILPILRDGVPAPTLSDGRPVERPSLLPAPGELEPGDPVGLRLRRLARMGLPLIGPASPENDELRLALCYLAGADRGAAEAVDALLARAETADRRLALLGVRAQVLLLRRDFERAGYLIEYLQTVRDRPSHEIQEGIRWRKVVPINDPRDAWPAMLAEKAVTLRKPPAETEAEPAPRVVPDADGLRGVLDPAPPAAPF